MRIEIIGPPIGLSGGPSSFRAALERALAESGHTLEPAKSRQRPDAVLVIGGTRHLARLARLRRAGTTVVLRLDGIPTAGWSQLDTRTRARQLSRVALILFIRAFLASKVVYQSHFSHDAWHSLPLGKVRQPESSIILNGTELDLFTPAPKKINQIAVVEGSISSVDGGVAIIEGVSRAFAERGRTETFLVCGRIAASDRARLEALPNVRVAGALTRKQVSTEVGLSRASLSLENEPACPNAVIESLSAGTPVVGFDTGAMAELVDPGSGELISMEIGSRRASAAHIQRLALALERVLDKHAEFSRAARNRSQIAFDIDDVAARYVEVMSAGPPDRLL